MAAWENKLSITTSIPPIFFFPQIYLRSMTQSGMELSFGQLEPAVPAVS